jgi:hypothetical protein
MRGDLQHEERAGTTLIKLAGKSQGGKASEYRMGGVPNFGGLPVALSEAPFTAVSNPVGCARFQSDC